MYGWFVRREIRRTFARVGSGDTDAILRGLAPDVEHRFAGDHPLGGTRVGKAKIEAWFDRLHRLFPDLDFDVHSVVVSGPPWAMTVAAEWTASVRPVVGPTYDNHGAHVIRVERGRVTSIHAYEDSQAVARACAQMLAAGIEEAGAPPITGAEVD
jgi:ketosteroid isomerase-like protein